MSIVCRRTVLHKYYILANEFLFDFTADSLGR